MSDWFRAERWDEGVEKEFETRLARARPGNRAQYLRIQAVTLMQLEVHLDVARRLFHRVVDEYPDDSLHAPNAYESLAAIARREGRLDEAETYLRACLDTALPTMSMTSGVPDLTLAEILIEQGGSEQLQEAADRLSSDDLQQRLKLRYHVFRFLVACARAAHALGQSDAGHFARRALEVAAETRPQFPRHPGVGDVQTDDETLADLWRIAQSEPSST